MLFALFGRSLPNKANNIIGVVDSAITYFLH